ncbi:hypothetical protein LJC19_05150 [Oxalobacter sp. OttesenSCG-928-P03]|nr:hypothetical protein [Oxalobacter sp. OttesenSCG-928-P03]
MTNERKTDWGGLRGEIAMAAARLIAEEGATYEMAKKKAAHQILGNKRINGKFLPDNTEIEEELRIYNALFMADTQPARLLHLRRTALQMMHELAQFQPYITGAVLNGTAGEHSDIHLQLFAESAKDVEIFLLNKNIDISVTESPGYRGKTQAVETIHFYYESEIFHLAVYNPDDMRKMVRAMDTQAERADIGELERLIEQQTTLSA